MTSVIRLICALFTAGSLLATDLDDKVVVFHAGSLSVPFKLMEKEFERLHPQVDVQLEASGSRACARKISDLKRRCDVMASADYTVIDSLLIPEHATWNIKFATSEMCIVYHEGSKRADEIDTDTWTEVLLDPAVAFGRSDPEQDPCGYRAVLTMQLAERFLERDGLAERLLKKDAKFIRPKETDLLALLESNTIDYIFLYRSVAKQHGLKYLILPDEVNLKSAQQADFYATASVQLSGKKPGETVTKRGQAMVYGITIPSRAENHAAALAFVSFVLDPKLGGAILAKQGLPGAVPSVSETWEEIPAALRVYARAPLADTEKE